MQTNPTVGTLGATLRDVTTSITQEPLPAGMAALLILLELAEEEQAKSSHNLPHWTSACEPKKLWWRPVTNFHVCQMADAQKKKARTS